MIVVGRPGVWEGGRVRGRGEGGREDEREGGGVRGREAECQHKGMIVQCECGR